MYACKKPVMGQKQQFHILSMLLPIISRYRTILGKNKLHGGKGCLGQNISVRRATWSEDNNLTSMKIKLTTDSQGRQTRDFRGGGLHVISPFAHISNQTWCNMSTGTAYALNKDNCVYVTRLS